VARTPADTSKGSRRDRKATLARARSIRCLSTYERVAREQGFQNVAGVDEVGRGCLFGPVFAAAVILHPDRPIRGLHDSKLLEADTRTRLAAQIKARCVCWAIGGSDVYEIDQINIYQASRLAMKRAVQALPVQPDYLLIDALKLDLPMQQSGLIGGDARCRAIAAASILAKVHRDACLDDWDQVFPQYHLKANKGYATPDHRRALKKHGPSFMHRFSFEPVRAHAGSVYWTGYVTDPQQPSLFGQGAAELVQPEVVELNESDANAKDFERLSLGIASG
jgi:ribonuclease HII